MKNRYGTGAGYKWLTLAERRILELKVLSYSTSGEETEAQRNSETCPRSHSSSGTRLWTCSSVCFHLGHDLLKIKQCNISKNLEILAKNITCNHNFPVTISISVFFLQMVLFSWVSHNHNYWLYMSLFFKAKEKVFSHFQFKYIFYVHSYLLFEDVHVSGTILNKTMSLSQRTNILMR